MSGIGTKNIQGNFKSMDIKPGNVVAKVNAIRMDKVKYPTNTPEFVIYLDLETKPIGNGFEGFAINKDKPELGKYKGQFKTITNTRWSIKDFTTRDGKKIDITKQVLKFIGQLLNECNSDWLDKVDGKFERIEDLVVGLNKDKPFKDIYLSWCLGGKEKINEKGYTNYYMHLPDYKVCPFPFAGESSGNTVTKYNSELHLIKDLSAVNVNEDLNNEVANSSDDDSTFAVNADEELFDFDEE